MKDYKGTIKNIEKITNNTIRMDIFSELDNISSGQFVSILCPNKTLRRPFSASNFQNGILTVLFKLKGEGTQYLSSLKKGDNINFIAPLGNGFNIRNKKSLLIGAGIGIAPMLFLKKELSEKNIKNYLITGFKERSEIVEGSDETIVGGSVLDNIDSLIEKFKPEVIYSCGPSIVLKLVSQIGIKYNIETQIALERVMACSIGVCRGCVIKLLKNNELVNASVCKDGPVFRGNEVVW